MAKSIPVAEFKKLSHLRTSIPQFRRLANSKLREVIALDTETIDGDIVVIADSHGNYLENFTPEELIDFLFSKRYHGKWTFFWNLGFDAMVILKTLGEKIIISQYRAGKPFQIQFGNYTINYIDNKSLSITKGHKSSVFFDIAQFFEFKKLDVAYQENIGSLSKQYLSMKEQRSNFTKSYYKRNKKRVREYCIQDCKRTQELSQYWVNIFYDTFDFYPNRFTSTGYLAEKCLLNNNVDIPKFDEIPLPIQELAWNAFSGGRMEILKRGFIGTAYSYDINSAYPYAFSLIPNLRTGQWVESKKILKNALIGFFKINVNIPEGQRISPLPFRTSTGLYFPVGKFETVTTLAELKTIPPTQYTILQGWQYVDDSPTLPYQDFVHPIYEKRMQMKKEKNPLQLPLKIILNSTYGKMAQRVGNRIGNIFCPVIASTITGTARAMLYEFVKQHKLEDSIVSFATDSIITTQKLDMDSNRLGQFKLDNMADDVYIIQTGFYRFNNFWKGRGVGRNIKNEIIYNSKCYEQDGRFYQRLKVLRVNKLRMMLIQKRFSDVGKFQYYDRAINLNADRKRAWLGNLTNIRKNEFNESVPFSFNHMGKNDL